MDTTMRAVVCPRYGPAEVLELRELPTPTPAAGEVLVRIHAATVGPADVAFRSGTPWFARLFSGLRRPKLSVLGDGFAGDVVAVGADAHRFAVGDRVFGLNPKRLGAHAGYMSLPEDGLLAAMPPGMTSEDAVSVLEAATALTFLRDVAKLRQGERVLVNGASGSVGCFGVQLAKHLGAHVTGVCSTANVELVRSLGADAVIDYTQQDFTADDQRYDVVFDAVGTSSYRRCKGVLAPRGRYLNTVPSFGIVGAMLWTALSRGRKARFAATGLMQTTDNLTFLAELFESGAIRSVIDRRYPLEDIAEAYRYVETGRKKGTAVVTM